MFLIMHAQGYLNVSVLKLWQTFENNSLRLFLSVFNDIVHDMRFLRMPSICYSDVEISLSNFIYLYRNSKQKNFWPIGEFCTKKECGV